MIKSRAIVFIESPLQLLNTVEALDFFSAKKSEIIIRLNSNEKNNTQIKNLDYLVGQHNIKYFKVSNEWNQIKDYLNALIISLNLIYFTLKGHKCFIGNIESKIFRTLKRFIPRNKVILLDDGTKTIAFQNKLTQQKVYSLFTCFELKAHKKQTLYKNDYKVLKSIGSIQKNNIPSIIIFLGSPLSEKNIMKEERYLNIIKLYLENKPFKENLIYIPHRDEDDRKLKKVHKLGFTIKRISYTVEFLPLKEQLQITHVISFYSTGLILIPKLYNAKASALKFDHSSAFNSDEIGKVYTYFNSCDYIDIIEV